MKPKTLRHKPMRDTTMRFAQKVIDTLVASGAWRATKYISDRVVVTATRKLFRRRLPGKRYNIEVILHSGRPNYREREFIKECKRAGVTFPVKKIHLQFPPKLRGTR